VEAAMSNNHDESVQRAAIAGATGALIELVAVYGPAAVRMDGNPEELTALHWAAASGAIDTVNYLLSPPINADPRAARKNNFTPLHSAAMQGRVAVCEVLLRAGAGVNVQTTPQGYAALHSAAFAGHLEAIQVLLSHGADRGLLNYRGERPADTARRQGQTAAAQLLDSDVSQ